MSMHANAAGPGPGAKIESSEVESPYAWLRLAAALALGTIGSIGMWSFVVALPTVQEGFGVARGDASLPFTLTMMGFGFGGVVMGRFADRYGIVWPVVIGALALPRKGRPLMVLPSPFVSMPAREIDAGSPDCMLSTLLSSHPSLSTLRPRAN